MEKKGLIIYVLGVLLIIGSYWLCWDWHNSYWHFLNWEKWYNEWSFPLPFYIYTFTPENHTACFDLALAMGVVGVILLSVGAWVIGRYK